MKWPFVVTGLGSSQVEDSSLLTLQGILEGAKRVFARDGFQHARLEDIACEAGHTPEELLELFESKAELFMTVRQQFADEWIGVLQRLVDSSDWTVEQTRQILRNQISKFIEPPQTRFLLVEFQRFSSKCSESFHWYSSFSCRHKRGWSRQDWLGDDRGRPRCGRRSEQFIGWFVVDVLFEPRMIDLLHADGLSVILLDALRKT